MRHVVGRIWNEEENKFMSVYGCEFTDAPGHYKFFEFGTGVSFRKELFAPHTDVVSEITLEMYNRFIENKATELLTKFYATVEQVQLEEV